MKYRTQNYAENIKVIYKSQREEEIQYLISEENYFYLRSIDIICTVIGMDPFSAFASGQYFFYFSFLFQS